MGMGEAKKIIDDLASQGLFLERELTRRGISRTWLSLAKYLGWVKSRGFNVWSHRRYEPSRYELVQLRFPRVVFWGPSALWLLGAEPREPDALWIAVDNKARVPKRLDLTTVVIRTRRLEESVVALKPQGRWLTLRVYSRERAETDRAHADCPRMLARAAQRAHFKLPRDGSFLTADPPRPRGHPLPHEDWVVAPADAATRTPPSAK